MGLNAKACQNLQENSGEKGKGIERGEGERKHGQRGREGGQRQKERQWKRRKAGGFRASRERLKHMLARLCPKQEP